MKNKKTLVIAIVAVVLVVAVVLGVVLLGGNNTDGSTTTTTKPAGSTGTEKEYKLGMGLVFGEMTNKEINATVATVVLDENNVIVACRIDAIQNKFEVDLNEGTVAFKELRTKAEQKYDYHMSLYAKEDQDNNKDGIIKEWFEQVQVFENYVVGKTSAQVSAIPQKKIEDASLKTNGYIIADDNALLSAGCTIQINEFINAVVKACTDATDSVNGQGTTFKANNTNFKLGIFAINGDNHSDPTGLSSDGETININMNSDIAAVVVDANGKILAALNDAIQPTVSVNWDGNVTKTTDGFFDSNFRTKREKKEDYHMAAWGESLVGNEKATEWYIQSAAFSNHIVGKTATQVTNLPTKEAKPGYVISGDQTLISAGCTMSISGMQSAVVKAIGVAR